MERSANDNDSGVVAAEVEIAPALLREAENALREAVKLAIARDKEARRQLYDPQTNLGPTPLLLGPQEYRDCSIWSPDWRRRLAEDDPDRPSDPDEFASWDDEQTRATLNTMLALGTPRRPANE